MQLRVMLADPAARLPMPDSPGAFAPAEPFHVSTLNPYWSHALADGSIVPAPLDPSPKPALPKKGA